MKAIIYFLQPNFQFIDKKYQEGHHYVHDITRSNGDSFTKVTSYYTTGDTRRRLIMMLTLRSVSDIPLLVKNIKKWLLPHYEKLILPVAVQCPWLKTLDFTDIHQILTNGSLES